MAESVMIMDPSSSFGLFAVVWMALCVISSALVTDAMLRSFKAVPDRGSNLLRRDGTEHDKSE